MPDFDLVKDGARQMTICNACRYCEGYCAVFPAMEQRRIFTKGDLTYLANLCFDCRDCYYACQYAPPHEFGVNIPKLMSELRADTYREFTWPAMFVGLVQTQRAGGERDHRRVDDYHSRARAGVPRPGCLFGYSSRRRHVLPRRAVYRDDRAAVADRALRFGGFHHRRAALLARDARRPSPTLVDFAALWRATKDAFGLAYMKGGGAGCNYPGESFSAVDDCGITILDVLRLSARLGRDDDRRVLRSFSRLAGAVSVFQRAGCSGHGWRHGLADRHGRVALFEMAKRPRAGADASMFNMDVAFLVLLFLTSFTGLLLFGFRETAAMGTCWLFTWAWSPVSSLRALRQIRPCGLSLCSAGALFHRAAPRRRTRLVSS